MTTDLTATNLEMNGLSVGTLSEEGNSLSFTYSRDWLTQGFELGPDVPLTRGRQFTRTTFGGKQGPRH